MKMKRSTMKKNTTSSPLLRKLGMVSFVPFALSSVSQAAVLIGRENFNYPNGAITDLAGGIGWSYQRTDEGHTNGPSDWDGTASVTNGALITTSNNSAFREFSGTTEGSATGTGEREGAFRAEGTFLFGVDVTFGGVSGWGGISIYDFGTERTFFGVNNSTFIISSSGMTTTALSGTTPVAGQTYRLVGQVDFDSDRLRLWINPTTQTSNYTTATLTVTGFTSTNWASKIRLAGDSSITWDNLEIATPSSGEADGSAAFALVIPEPSSFSLLGAFGVLGLLRRRRN